MIYNPPLIEGKEVWVPIVVKNRDWLVGYIRGVNFARDVIGDVFEDLEIDLDFNMLGLGIDSSRFNDILPNDRRVSTMSKKEIQAYFENATEEACDKLDMCDNPDDIKGSKDVFLVIECPCNFGYYTYETEEDLPHDSIICQNCGRPLIQYTNADDFEFDYDGKD